MTYCITGSDGFCHAKANDFDVAQLVARYLTERGIVVAITEEGAFLAVAKDDFA